MTARSLDRSPALQMSRATAAARGLVARCLAMALCCLALMLASPTAHAQTAAPAAGTMTQQDAKQLLTILNDPQKREEFSKTLSLMAKGLPAAQAATGGGSKPVITDDVHTELHGLTSTAQGYVSNFTSLFKDLEFVGEWFRDVMRDQTLRKTLIEAFSSAFLVLAVAIVAERATSIALRKPLRKVTSMAEARQARQAVAQSMSAKGEDTTQTRETDQRRGDEVLRYLSRVPYNLMHFLLKLVPVGVCMLLGYMGAEFLPGTEQSRTVTLTLTNAYVIARGLYLVVETLLVQHSPAIRLIPASDSTARVLTRWWNVLVAAPSIVICLSTLGGEFDLAQRGVDAMLRAVVLIQHLIVAAFLWRIRRIVGDALQPSSERKKNALWAFAGSLARLWWVPVMFLDLALWFVWAAHLKGGYQWLLHGSVLSFLCLVLSRVVALLLYGLQDRLFRVSPAMQEQYPDLQKRADFYYPFVRRITTGFILFGTAVGLAQSWSVPALSFLFTSALGLRLTSALLCLLVGLTIAVLAWEVVNGILNKQISRYSSSAQMSRASRLRTVLPIIRTVLLVVIIILVSVTTLSQIGINVTPLLTGAGILGVGLSFGSQSLVKDVITGFFMLAEDAIQVGDWVTTGGIAGTVEHLSIRTLRVRAFDGDLHIIPFSSVTSIANTAKDFNQIIVRQTLDLGEDTEKVAEIFKDTIRTMRQEEAFRSLIFSDYMDLGVDSSDQNGAVLLGIIKTAPMMKWKVQREFYRRTAQSMTQAGVKFYVNTSYSTTPPNLPMHLALDAMPPGPMDTGRPTEPSSAPAARD